MSEMICALKKNGSSGGAAELGIAPNQAWGFGINARVQNVVDLPYRYNCSSDSVRFETWVINTMGYTSLTINGTSSDAKTSSIKGLKSDGTYGLLFVQATGQRNVTVNVTDYPLVVAYIGATVGYSWDISLS